MPKGSRLSFNPEAGTDRAFVRCGFAPRAASVTALLIASTALTAIAFVPSAHAGTPQWLGTASSDWFANGNWSGSPSAVPSAADVSTTIDTTAPNTTVINGAAAATQQLVVGNSGNGNLAITNGGSLGSTNSDLGFFGGSSGTVTVSGSGSSWAVGTSLWVGYNGTGTVQVLQGGVTHADTFSLGVISGSHGAATVDGVGSILSANTSVIVGDGGDGKLTVSAGGQVHTSIAEIGNGAGSQGAAVVTGAGSSLVASSSFAIGAAGTGSLTVANGGAVFSSQSALGALAGSSGTATIDGAGSTWTLGSGLVVGNSGAGTLTILNGGAVNANFVDTVIGVNGGSTGSVTLDGSGSKLTMGGAGLVVGSQGSATLAIANGGAVSNVAATIGSFAGSTGTVSVDGAGSTWINTAGLDVGYSGTGTLKITNGGLVTSGPALGPGAVVNIGTNAGATGTVLVDGAGSTLGVQGSGNVLSVGTDGTGTLNIKNGGAVASGNAYVGQAAGSTGSVLVDGAQSSLNTGNMLALGYGGRGTLMISNGGTVVTNAGALGVVGHGSGSAVIDGAGSSWLVSDLFVGVNSTGSIAVTHGGGVLNINGLIGAFGGSNGSVAVDGAGSSWTNQSFLAIGDAGTGSLTIANGGAVSANGQVLIANQAGSTGNLNIGAASGSAATAPGTLMAATVQFGLGTGAINFNHTSASYLFSPDIVGNGAVNQLSGTTILTGNSTYTGPTTVDGGTLSVNGSIANSTTTVNAGGTLGGIGMVGDTTISGGVLAPGNTNSIGTLTIAGNLVLTTAASYMVQVSGTSTSKTVVVGAANLAGTVAVNLTGRVSATTTYTILTSANTTGTFDSVSMSNSAYARNARVTYSGNNVLLTLDPGLLSPSLPGFANINQKNVAAGIDNALLAGGSMTTGFNTLFNATGQNLLNGLTQASGEVATGAQQGTFNAMGQFLNTLFDPFFGNRNDPAAPAGGASRYADDGAAARANAGRDAYAAIGRQARGAGDSFTQRWSVWAAGYGGSQTTDGNVVVGSNTATSRIAGVAAGADYQISPNTLVGFALGGGGTSFGVANGLGSGSSDLFQAGVYARHTTGNAYVAGAFAYGWQDVTTDRTVTIAGADHLRARFKANALSGRLEGGYRYATPWMGITPYAAAQFTSLYLPGYGEQAISGANTFALNYAGRDVTAARGELGLRTDRSYALETAILTLRGRAAWAHDVNPDRGISATFQTLPGASFVVNGAASAHDAALLTGAAELKWLNGVSLSGTFEGEFSNVTRSYAGKGIARYQW